MAVTQQRHRRRKRERLGWTGRTQGRSSWGGNSQRQKM